MDLDDEVCLCFHVTKRKLVNFLRIEKPRRAGQLSECFGAGTGCGWCRNYLERMFQAAVSGGVTTEDEPTPADYAKHGPAIFALAAALLRRAPPDRPTRCVVCAGPARVRRVRQPLPNGIGLRGESP